MDPRTCPLEKGQTIRFQGSDGYRTVMAVEMVPQRGEFDVKLDNGEVLSVKPKPAPLVTRLEMFLGSLAMPQLDREQIKRYSGLMGELRAMEKVVDEAAAAAARLKTGAVATGALSEMIDAVDRLRLVRGDG